MALKALTWLSISQAARIMRRQLHALPWFLLGGVIGIWSIALLLGGAFAWLSHQMPPLAAYLSLGFGLLLLAAVAIAIGASIRDREPPKRKSPAPEEHEAPLPLLASELDGDVGEQATSLHTPLACVFGAGELV